MRTSYCVTATVILDSRFGSLLLKEFRFGPSVLIPGYAGERQAFAKRYYNTNTISI